MPGQAKPATVSDLSSLTVAPVNVTQVALGSPDGPFPPARLGDAGRGTSWAS